MVSPKQPTVLYSIRGHTGVEFSYIEEKTPLVWGTDLEETRMEPIKILAVIGTRPEAVKLCPLVKELKKRRAFRTRVLATGQHGRMCADVLRTFGVRPDRSFSSMRIGSTPDATAGVILTEMGRILGVEEPDLVIVQGDTTTAFAAALCAFYRKIPVAHVEAGLRTYDMLSPFPEEWHRRAVGLLSTYHFAPTASAALHLRTEGVDASKIYTVGNTVTDALVLTAGRGYDSPLTERLAGKRLVLASFHRRENAEHITAMLGALRDAVGKYREDTYLLCEAHPNPEMGRAVAAALDSCPFAGIAQPLPVEEYHALLSHAYFSVTDSGGIQEEAAFLGIPTLIARESTERPEGIGCGVLRLCGTDGAVIGAVAEQLLSDASARSRMAVRTDVYGDGHVSERIAGILEDVLGVSGD